MPRSRTELPQGTVSSPRTPRGPGLGSEGSRAASGTAGIKLAVRVRPLVPREAGKPEGVRVHPSESRVTVFSEQGVHPRCRRRGGQPRPRLRPCAQRRQQQRSPHGR
ncbi:unnamed protein product [Prorocentrum cordatum]|uniref:Kinesin-like protein n=1 Tax=Prorocentrum cordatum TaxID=2364126 RepID=A0ABN9RQ82_9DINO|nr:unnamed protein product [Polarella glacialis]